MPGYRTRLKLAKSLPGAGVRPPSQRNSGIQLRRTRRCDDDSATAPIRSSVTWRVAQAAGFSVPRKQPHRRQNATVASPAARRDQPPGIALGLPRRSLRPGSAAWGLRKLPAGSSSSVWARRFAGNVVHRYGMAFHRPGPQLRCLAVRRPSPFSKPGHRITTAVRQSDFITAAGARRAARSPPPGPSAGRGESVDAARWPTGCGARPGSRDDRGPTST